MVGMVRCQSLLSPPAAAGVKSLPADTPVDWPASDIGHAECTLRSPRYMIYTVRVAHKGLHGSWVVY
jgi:hypothetical protein